MLDAGLLGVRRRGRHREGLWPGAAADGALPHAVLESGGQLGGCFEGPAGLLHRVDVDVGLLLQKAAGPPAGVERPRVPAGCGINASVIEGLRYRECEGRPSHRAVWTAASMSSSCASVQPGSTLAITVACLPWVVAPPAVW